MGGSELQPKYKARENVRCAKQNDCKVDMQNIFRFFRLINTVPLASIDL